MNSDIVSAMPKDLSLLTRTTHSRRAVRLFSFAVVGAIALVLECRAASVTSPDGEVVISFDVVHQPSTSSESGQLVYSVEYRGKPLITQSVLQLKLLGEHALGDHVQIAREMPSQTDETYRLVTGKASLVRNHYNALRLQMEETSGPRRQLEIEARAYDDAVAFRYVVPDQR